MNKNKNIGFNLKGKEMIARARGQFDLFGQVGCPACGKSFPIDIIQVDYIKPVSGFREERSRRTYCFYCRYFALCFGSDVVLREVEPEVEE